MLVVCSWSKYASINRGYSSQDWDDTVGVPTGRGLLTYPHHKPQLNVLPLLDQGGPNPVVRLTVGVINLPGSSEVLERLVPVAVPPLKYAAVQAHLAAAQAHLQSAASLRVPKSGREEDVSDDDWTVQG